MRKQNLCMSKETAFKAVDFLLAYSKDQPSVNVTFFGGEPLLSVGLMEDAAEYATEQAKALSKKVSFACTTNGTLLTEKALDISRQYGFLYLLSMDGDKDAHDKHRRYLSGKGSFDDIAAKIPMLKRKQGWLGARVTVSPDSIHRLCEGVKNLFDMGINQFLIGLVHEGEWDGETLREIERQYDLLLQFYLCAKGKNLPLRLTMFERDLETIRKERKHFWGCGAGMGRLAITPDGRIYPCSRFVGSDGGQGQYQIGHLEEGFDRSNLPEFLRAKEWVRPKCKRCALAGICSGGCPAANLEVTGSLYEPPKSYCAEMRAWANTIAKLPSDTARRNAPENPCPVEG